MHPETPPLTEGCCHTLRGMAVARHRFRIETHPLPGLTIDGLREPVRREVTVRVRSAVSSWKSLQRGVHVRIDPMPAPARAAPERGSPGLPLPGCSGLGRTELLELQLALALCGSDAPVVAGVRLDGRLQPIAGALLYAEAHKDAGASHLLCTRENADEVALAGLPVFFVEHLADCTRDTAELTRFLPDASASPTPAWRGALPDLDEVLSAEGRRVLEIAAAGGHGLLLTGPPGVGKTMLARRLTTILPPPQADESLSITRCASAAGLTIAGPGLITRRPFRAPHASTGIAGLLGGGSPHPRPGELTLASHGVLFLDDVTEFQRAALVALREPIAAGEFVFHRADGTFAFPSRVHLIAAMNPCPCGRRGLGSGLSCRCSGDDVRRFEERAAPINALFDLRLRLPPMERAEREASNATRESSVTVCARVTACRALQQERQGKENARLGLVDIDRHAPLTRDLWKSFARELDTDGVIAVRRVARTIADLAGSTAIEGVHLEEALQWSRPRARA